jgi:hypothetical protein
MRRLDFQRILCAVVHAGRGEQFAAQLLNERVDEAVVQALAEGHYVNRDRLLRAARLELRRLEEGER